MSSDFSYTVSTPSERVDTFLAKISGRSRAFVQEQIEKGCVLLNGKPIKKMSQKVKAGETLSGTWKEDSHLELVPISRDLNVLYEDEFLLALNKEQGIVVHPAPGHKGETLVHYLLHHVKNNPEFVATSATRPGLVHRLDRGTSGVLLIAKTRQVQEALQIQFRRREVEKEYEAIVWGKVKEKGTFSSAIGRDTQHRKKMSSKTTKARPALTTYSLLSATKHFSHVALLPKTGRTHQLRVHLVENKTPIVGDDLYGNQKRKTELMHEVKELLPQLTQTLLHAKRLTFTHPITQERLTFSAPRPEIFETFLNRILKWDQ